MMKRAVPIIYQSYVVHQTDEFKQTLGEAYADLENMHGTAFADKWHKAITHFIDSLEAPSSLGHIDPANFSDRYIARQISGTKTTIFFLVEQDQIYLVTSGYSVRNWRELLQKKEAALKHQIEILKGRLDKSH